MQKKQNAQEACSALDAERRLDRLAAVVAETMFTGAAVPKMQEVMAALLAKQGWRCEPPVAKRKEA
jgi:hypothetical protein